MWLLSVTKSQVWLGSRCVKFGVIALWSLEVQAGTSLQRTLRGSVKKIVTLHKDGVCQNPETELQHGGQSRPYSGLTGQVPFRTGLAMVDQKSWVHVLSIISRGCVWEIDVWVLPALLQRLKGWVGGGDQSVSAQTIRRTLHQIGLHGCRLRRKPSKDDAQESPQTVSWRQVD